MKQRLSEMNLPRFPMLSESETHELLSKTRQGDQEAREYLINCNLKLIFSLVQRFQYRGYELEDLFQIGTIGLMKAIDKFDPSFGVKFSTYAVPMIIGEIRRFIRDDSPVKISRSLKELSIKIHKARESLTKKLGRDPTVKELSEELSVETDQIIAALESGQTMTSIHDTVFQGEGDSIYVLDQLAAESELDDTWFEKLNIKDVMRQIPPRLSQIVLQRFFEDRTQVEVGKQLGISQVQVSRLERQALKLIRQLLSENSQDK